DVEHVANLKGPIGTGGPEHHRRLRIDVRSAFDVILENLPLHGCCRNAVMQFLERAPPRLGADGTNIAHAVYFPFRLDQPTTPTDWPRIDKARAEQLLLQQFKIDDSNTKPGFAPQLDPEFACIETPISQDVGDSPVYARLLGERHL